MNYEGLLASQRDSQYPFDALPADDFILETPYTCITDVHWVGGYWNPGGADGLFDWEVTFYNDDGTGNAPNGVYAGPFTYTDSQIVKTILDPGDPWYAEYYVDLPDAVCVEPGQKYWISIQGIGFLNPQSGWAYHTDPILLHEAVFGSDYFGIPFWTNTGEVLGYPVDMCFQLTPEPTSLILLSLGAVFLRRR